jgi:glycolate oxidase FAD binding subunit
LTDTPADEAGIRDAIASARAAREPLLIRGAGTKAAMLRPVQAGRTLSTRALSGVTLYSPQELVIAARAGTPLRELEALVAQRGQQLIAEPPDLAGLLGTEPGAQTLGGVVASNLSGPRRVAWGAMRDHVLGVRAVNGRAEAIASGGRVLKNVTGLDLCKLLTGSHGTLAVLSEITLKVLPAPERVGTVIWRGLDPVRGVAALAAALGSPFSVSGAAYLPAEAARTIPVLADARGAAAIARIEDFVHSVTYRTERLARDAAGFGPADILGDAESRELWRAVRDAAPLADPAGAGDGEGAVWRVSVRPSQGPAVAAAVAALPGLRWFLDWGGGLVWLRGPATTQAHDLVAQAARRAGGTWVLLRAAAALRAGVDVVPPEPPALAAITRRVKAAFDPDGILNPGRMFPGL